MKNNVILLLFLVLLSCCKVKEAPLKSKAIKTTDFNKISEQFLEFARDGKDTNALQDQLANVTLEELSETLVTDEQKFAFWINIYNGYIQVILKEHPEYYNDRRAFFSKEQIKIAGETVAFSKIEHGIIRKSQWELGLGYFRTWFPDKFERKLRVKKRDYRIHFALNCGAKDCPPVAIYTPKRIKEQLEKGTEIYLKRTSEYDSDKNEVGVTSLFSWFRGDFGGKSGVKKILKEQGIIKDTKGVDLVYNNYDWTLDLDNFIDL
ncbi:DUF547 domain-containing protein [Croceitalea sp. MTPC9]|uniref:DUF547 domain-containing protein n=1 Tax=unclassified Croceitalea TaxID=2632280 RepID=UPI002B373DDC|nr:DUF547 domain-containing protein [Croceitalea sp. MTPC6]GMN15338.1 DUF547 domain-containing protein [Croceitalea sp. MTPC9]